MNQPQTQSVLPVSEPSPNPWLSLLRRSPRPLAAAQTEAPLYGKRVLVTGAGGSIGSALSIQLAHAGLSQLILLDSSERSLYEIDQTVLSLPGTAPHTSILASIADPAAVAALFAEHRPQVVFHAAALKHVPLVESNPFTAIATNVLGTEILLQAASGCEHFLLVSTDKAADPVSWMGASKRIAELAALALSPPSARLSVIRLANVLGSSGSVVPRFQQQIAMGVPVTVSHPEATRFFLTLEETIEALLTALSPTCPGGLLVSSPGEAIRIDDLAAYLIAQAGASNPIIHTGLRPGDKLSEALLSTRESYTGLSCGSLLGVHTPRLSTANLQAGLDDLRHAVEQRTPTKLLDAVQSLVPEYCPSPHLLAHLALNASAQVPA